MLSWTKLLAILYQRKQVRDETDERSRIIYQELRDKNLIVSDEGGFYLVEFESKEPVPEDLFPYPDTDISITESYTPEGHPILRYEVMFTYGPELLVDMFNLEQLRFRPYSPIYPQENTEGERITNTFDGKVSFPVGLQSLPTRSTRSSPTSSFQLLPEELKHHILTYEGEESMLEQVLKPDAKYLAQEAKLLDPTFSLEQLEKTLEERDLVARRVRYLLPLFHKLQQLKSLKLTLSEKRDTYRFFLESYQGINPRDYLDSLGEVRYGGREHLDYHRMSGNTYYYVGNIVNTQRTLDTVYDLNVIANLTSEGYSAPYGEVELFQLNDEWLTLPSAGLVHSGFKENYDYYY